MTLATVVSVEVPSDCALVFVVAGVVAVVVFLKGFFVVDDTKFNGAEVVNVVSGTKEM